VNQEETDVQQQQDKPPYANKDYVWNGPSPIVTLGRTYPPYLTARPTRPKFFINQTIRDTFQRKTTASNPGFIGPNPSRPKESQPGAPYLNPYISSGFL
jgi:hypothetical protein